MKNLEHEFDSEKISQESNDVTEQFNSENNSVEEYSETTENIDGDVDNSNNQCDYQEVNENLTDTCNKENSIEVSSTANQDFAEGLNDDSETAENIGVDDKSYNKADNEIESSENNSVEEYSETTENINGDVDKSDNKCDYQEVNENLTDTCNKESLIEKSGDTTQDLGDESDIFNFKLENFEGPLDLLLHLIKQSKMDIENVELAKITEQYLTIMSTLPQLDLEKATDFVEIAASLIEIKSKALLPKLLDNEEIDEEDAETLLLRRLQEYKLFKETSEKLHLSEDIDKFYKQPEEDAHKFRVVLKDMSLDLLLDAFTKLLTKTVNEDSTKEPKKIEKEVFTVEQKISAIKDALIFQPKIRFSQLFKESISRDEIITTFLALLELLKLQQIKCVQNNEFEDIEILKLEGDGNE